MRTLNGSVTASVGEWIVRGVAGELYPCRNDIFRATYEEVREVGLGPAELEVVRLVAEGYSSREIATLRGVSVKTVESQRTSAMQKVGANRTALLVRYAVHVGLVSGMPKTEGA